MSIPDCNFSIYINQINQSDINLRLSQKQAVQFKCILFFFQVQDLGLQADYNNDRGTYAFIRKVMALPFLPAEQIPAMYTRLQAMASTQKLQQLMQYVGRNWITSSTWPPSSWSVFMKSIRTNNDIEGWHLGLNRRASGKSQLPLYLLISLLHREARRTSLQIRLVSEKKLRRIQKKKFRDLQTKIFNLWDEFNSGSRSARKLLKACSYLSGPVSS